ncbi:hypothetical protein JCM10449v2_000020 [Rhodotorula kratochvilovae]
MPRARSASCSSSPSSPGKPAARLAEQPPSRPASTPHYRRSRSCSPEALVRSSSNASSCTVSSDSPAAPYSPHLPELATPATSSSSLEPDPPLKRLLVHADHAVHHLSVHVAVHPSHAVADYPLPPPRFPLPHHHAHSHPSHSRFPSSYARTSSSEADASALAWPLLPSGMTSAAAYDYPHDAHTPVPQQPPHLEPFFDPHYRPYPPFGGYEHQLDPAPLYGPFTAAPPPPLFPPHVLQGYPVEPAFASPFFPSPPPSLQMMMPHLHPTPPPPPPMPPRRASAPNPHHRRGIAQRGRKSLREMLDAGEHIPSRGRVKFFNARKGYGFIVDDQNADLQADVFAHYTGVDLQNGFRCLAKDERVEYILTTHSKGGYQALCITGEHGAPLRGLSDAHNAAIVREMAAETNAKRAGELSASAKELVAAAAADRAQEGALAARKKGGVEQDGGGKRAKGLMLSGMEGEARE